MYGGTPRFHLPDVSELLIFAAPRDDVVASEGKTPAIS